MRRSFIIPMILLAGIALQQSVAAQAPSASTDPLRHGHALLIGNSNYISWPHLDDVPLQLDELAAGLKDHFDTVEVMKDLTIKSLRQKINGFLRLRGNDSNARLFVYYAGHGYTEPIYNTTKIVDTSPESILRRSMDPRGPGTRHGPTRCR